MSKWDFKRESAEDAQGDDPVKGLNAGNQPFFNADALASKRNVIATNLGWIRRQAYTDTHGNVRQKDEILVAAHPGGADGYESAAHLGFPDIAQVYSDVDGISAPDGSPVTATFCVVFNEPIRVNDGGDLQIALANTAGGNNAKVATAVATDPLANANNTLCFAMSFTSGDVGTYQIAAGAGVTNATATAISISSLNAGGETANVTITGAVSNAFGEFIVS